LYGQRIDIKFVAGERDWFSLQSVQTSMGGHLALYPLGTGGKVAGSCSWPLSSI